MGISWGGYWPGPGPNGSDVGANAAALPITVNGHQAFGIKVTQGVGYRIDNAQGVPTGSQPEGIYMVTSSNLVNNQCCFDFGSGETSHTDTGNATMNAIEWGTPCWFATWSNNPCVGTGPWVEADLENGMYHTTTGSNKDPNNSGVHFPFVSAFEKNKAEPQLSLHLIALAKRDPIASQRFRIGILGGDLLFNESQRLIDRSVGAERWERNAAPPHFVGKAHSPIWLRLDQR